MNSQVKSGRPFGAWNVELWVLQGVTAAAFLMAGIAKLSGQPMMVENYDKIGVGQWFRYVTGTIEIGSAILLLIPRLTPVGAALLVCTMIGAVLAQVFALRGSAAPALVLGCFAAVILWGRFATVRAWLGGPSARAATAAGA